MVEYFLNVFHDLNRARTHLEATGKKVIFRHHEVSHRDRGEALQEIIDLNGYQGLRYDHTLHVAGDKAEVIDLIGEACKLVHEMVDEERDTNRLRRAVMSQVL